MSSLLNGKALSRTLVSGSEREKDGRGGGPASLGMVAHQGGRKGFVLAKPGVHISKSQERQLAQKTGSLKGSVSTLLQDLQGMMFASGRLQLSAAPASGTILSPSSPFVVGASLLSSPGNSSRCGCGLHLPGQSLHDASQVHVYQAVL